MAYVGHDHCHFQFWCALVENLLKNSKFLNVSRRALALAFLGVLGRDLDGLCEYIIQSK